MSQKIDPNKLLQLKEFVRLCETHPEVLHLPELDFFKQYIKSLGHSIPPLCKEAPPEPVSEQPMETKAPPTSNKTDDKLAPPPSTAEESESEESSEESDLDVTITIEPDNDPSQEMGDSNKEATEMDKSQKERVLAKSLVSDSAPDFSVLTDLLAGISDKWFELGVPLKVPQHIRNGLRENHSENTTRLIKVLEYWRDNSEVPYTWQSVKEALSHSIVEAPRKMIIDIDKLIL